MYVGSHYYCESVEHITMTMPYYKLMAHYGMEWDVDLKTVAELKSAMTNHSLMKVLIEELQLYVVSILFSMA